MSDLSIQTDRNAVDFGDLILEDGDLILNSGTDAILQDILQRLRTIYGEWFLDTSVGLPYFTEILVKNPDQGKIDAIFLDAISKVPGVEVITKYSFSPDFAKRSLAISFTVITTSGTVDYSGLISS